MTTDSPRSILTDIGTFTSRPTAFVIVGLYVVAMAVFAPEELNWHSVATLATWLMTLFIPLFIQRAEHRDTQAIHMKLDELLRTDSQASSDVARADEKEPEEIERERDRRQERPS
jgi:low affinity Fe/Cu permease